MLALVLAASALAAVGSPASRVGRSAMSMAAPPGKVPVSIVVEVEIEPSRLDDFLKVIEEDAVGSRERENGGCLRFDVLRDQEKSNVFRFYEVYVDAAAIDFHKNTPHFALWKDFKASGGVISQTSSKNDCIFFTG